MYKNLQLAAFYEFCVGLLSLIVTILAGESGTLILVLIALRPVLLEKTTIVLGTVEKYYEVGKTSIIVTAGTLVLYYLSAEYVFSISLSWKLISMLIIPYFVVSHGAVGLFLNSV